MHGFQSPQPNDKEQRSIDVQKLECDTDDKFQFVNTEYRKTLTFVSHTLEPKLSREYHWTEANHRRRFDTGVYSSKPASIKPYACQLSLPHKETGQSPGCQVDDVEVV
jgi:hypothetical protein